MRKIKTHKMSDTFLIYSALTYYKNSFLVEYTKTIKTNEDVEHFNKTNESLYRLITKYEKKLKRHTR